MEYGKRGKEVQLPSWEPVAAAMPAAKVRAGLALHWSGASAMISLSAMSAFLEGRALRAQPMSPFELAVPVQFSKIFE